MDKNIKMFILSIFLLPIVPTIILWLKFPKIYALTLILLFWFAGFWCLISKKNAKRLQKIINAIFSFIGKYIAIFILFFGYISVVIPTALCMKLTKRDRLRLKKTDVDSYWLNINDENKDYERQF